MFAIASMFWAPTVEAVVWLGLVIGAKVVLIESCRRFLAQPRDQVDVEKWRRRFIISELFNGPRGLALRWSASVTRTRPSRV